MEAEVQQGQQSPEGQLEKRPPSPPWAGIPLQRGLGHRVRQHVNPLQVSPSNNIHRWGRIKGMRRR